MSPVISTSSSEWVGSRESHAFLQCSGVFVNMTVLLASPSFKDDIRLNIAVEVFYFAH